jgi:molybdate transport system substrate-binding protein
MNAEPRENAACGRPPRHFRTAAASKLRAALPLLAAWTLALGCSGAAKEPRLLLYCGAGIRPPVSETVAEFERRQGVKIECDYAGSEVLLSRIKLTGRGDLYMPGDVHYVEQAEREGLVDSKRTVCCFVPVIMVQKGNPKGIRALADLTRPGIKLGLGDPEACAVGRQSTKIFQKNGIPPEAIEPNVAFRAMTVNDLGNHIELCTLDAAIVWDAVAACYPDHGEIIPIPPEQNIVSTVAVGTLKSTANPKLAAAFVEFITSDDGKAIFRKHHYSIAPPE